MPFIPVCDLLRKKAGIELGRQVVALSICVFLICFHTECLLFAQGNSEASLNLEQWQKRLSPTADELTSTLDELQQHSEVIKQVIPELSAILDRGSETEQKLAARCLRGAGAVPDPTLNLLVRLLDHPDNVFRAEVAQTLRQLGPQAVPKLQAALDSDSPRVRSSSLSILNHLVTVDVSILEKLQQDPDERVRISVARAWLKHGKPGVRKTGELTADPALPVALVAIEVLQFNETDPETAAAIIGKCAHRKELYEASACALETLGRYAAVAIPDLIGAMHKNEPPFDWRRGFETIVHEALTHIGPARTDELPRLIALLEIPDPRTQELVAELIGRLDREAEIAAPELEKTCLLNARESEKLRQTLLQTQDETQQQEINAKIVSCEEAYQKAFRAFWHVTDDVPRTMKLMEQVVAITKSPFYSYLPNIDHVTSDDVRRFVGWLNSEDPHLKETAQSLWSRFPASALDSDLLREATRTIPVRLWTLEQLASREQDADLPIQLAEWSHYHILGSSSAARDFAQLVKAKQLGVPMIVATLRAHIKDKNVAKKANSLALLVALEENDAARTQLVVDYVSEYPELREKALDIFRTQNVSGVEQIRFATDSLADSDSTVVYSALSLLAEAGPAASSSLDAIRNIPESKNTVNLTLRRLRRIAICSITNDKSLYQENREILDKTKEDPDYVHNPIEVLHILGPRCEQFFPEIESNLSLAPKNPKTRFLFLAPALKALSLIGNERARTILSSYENDRDWTVQRYVRWLKSSNDSDVDGQYFSEDF